VTNADLIARGKQLSEAHAKATGDRPPVRDLLPSRIGAEQLPEMRAVENRSPDSFEPENAVDGADFVLNRPAGIPSLWGQGSQVLWPAGEALMIAGGQGLGKTSIALLVVRELLGLGRGELLGLPLPPIDGRVLYLAMDRPQQIARAAGRIFTENDRAVLSKKLHVWRGPPPRDLAANPALLARIVDHYDAAVVVVDSLKDAAVRLSEDAVGAQWNRSRQHVLAQGCQVLELHHTVKRGPQGAPVAGVSDIYGSTWLTSGCGSIVLLTGDPGDPVIGFRHLKQPAEEVGPFRLLHDQAAGTLTVDHVVDLVELVRASGVHGLNARDAAAAVTEKRQPTRGDIEKARRRLDQLVGAGLLVRIEGSASERGGKTPSAWFLAELSNHAPITRNGEAAGQSNHALFDARTPSDEVTPITRNAKPLVEQSHDQSRQSRTPQSRNPPSL
jgi:hypothetical protein